MAKDQIQRQPHAVMDLPSRRFKGMKIERLLGLETSSSALRLLEVGTGSGGIAHYFANHAELELDVDSVDVLDSRTVSDGYRFHQVDSVILPFSDDCFDIVISNHVIEHVGDEGQQIKHLQELKRVLRPDGIGYLAVPNRWMLVEPHYKLAFLSWWPESWRSGYLRLAGRGNHYDCRPLAAQGLENALEAVDFAFRNISIKALRTMLEIETGHQVARTLTKRLPAPMLERLARLSPTLIYLFAHKRSLLSSLP